MVNKRESKKLLLFALLSPIFSNIATVIASKGTKEIPPLLFLSIYSLIGSFLLLVILYASRKSINLKKIKGNLGDLSKVVALRGVAGNILLMFGLSITSGISAIFFTKMEPYFVLMWNWILKREKIRKTYLGLLSVHICGVVLLASGGAFAFSGTELGDLLIIAAMALFALSYIPSRKISEEMGAVSSNIVTGAISGIIVLPFALLFLTGIGGIAHVIQPSGWYYLFLYIFFFFMLALTLWFASLKGVKAWIVSALRAVGPLVGAPFAWIFFGQTLNTVQIIGAGIVLATSFVISIIHTRSK
jgi:drug/metabolite transporter (DMT)-like permease